LVKRHFGYVQADGQKLRNEATVTLTSNFPRLGLATSRLGFGGVAMGLTNYLGHYDAAKRRDVSLAAVRRAVERGITYFDTAPGYGNGLSEEIMSEALEGVSGVVLATKVPIAAATDVRGSLEASLRRLRRSRVDLLQIHGSSFDGEPLARLRAKGGMVDQLVRLREEGLTSTIGFTSEDNNRGVYVPMDTDAFDTIQISYNVVLQHPYEPTRPFGSLFEAKRHGLFTISMRTFTSGIFQKWIRLTNPADCFDYTTALIQFVLSNPLIDAALVGMRTPEEVDANVATWRDEAGRIDLTELWTRYVET
jgi:aryl-alcohol dehydrogenase-like predicted oxidoreductase